MGKIRYKGFTTKIVYDEENEMYVGVIDGIGEFHGETKKEAIEQFELAVNNYVRTNSD